MSISPYFSEQPQNRQYKAKAHGYGCLIDESDHNSKAVLEALNDLFVSQAGLSKRGDSALMLPLSPLGNEPWAGAAFFTR